MLRELKRTIPAEISKLGVKELSYSLEFELLEEDNILTIQIKKPIANYLESLTRKYNLLVILDLDEYIELIISVYKHEIEFLNSEAFYREATNELLCI